MPIPHERRDKTDLGELRRRLYIAERAECVKLAEMWRKQIQELERFTVNQTHREREARRE